MTWRNDQRRSARRVFISYSYEDQPFIDSLAQALTKWGTNISFSRWEFTTNSSIMDKIFQEGLSKASALVVVLSKASVAAPWVKKELRASTIRRIEGITKVIPILKDDVEVPVAFRALLWVDMRDNFDRGVEAIHNALRAESGMPSLQVSWHVVDMPSSVGGLTESATRVARLILQANDLDSDIVRGLRSEVLSEALDMVPQELNEAIRELRERGLVKTYSETGSEPYEFPDVEPTYLLYFHFSDYFHFDPVDDVKRVASAILALEEADGQALQERTNLSHGRLNRAVDYIREYGIADVIQYLGTSPYTFGLVKATRRTSKYVSDRTEGLF